MEWKRKILVSIVWILAFGIGETLAETVKIRLVAEIRSVDDAYDLLEGRIRVGDVIMGSYVYDSGVADSTPSPTVGDYWHYNPPYGISLSAGGFNFRTDPNNVEFLVELVNDHGRPSEDNYLIRSYNNLALYEGVSVGHISWQLDDDSGNALSSDALAAIPPVLADWESVFGLDISGARARGEGFMVRADVVSVRVVPQRASQYEVIRIQVPDLGHYNQTTFISGINNHGRIVGTYEMRGRSGLVMKRPFVWDDNTYYEYRGWLYTDDFFGGSKKINDSDDVIIFEDPDSLEEAEKDYVCLDGAPSSVYPINFIANDINNKGYIVGENYIRIDWSETEICPDSNDSCVACGINDGEVIVGYVKEGRDRRRPAMWKNGQITFLPTSEAYDGGYALQINKHDQVIGYLTRGGHRGSVPCIWEDGSVTVLSALTEVYAINDYGRIVGSDEGRKALLWDDGEVIDLNSLISTDPNDPGDWDRLNKAVGINNDDWIIGYGYLNEDRNDWHRREYAFMARPKQPANADIDDSGVVDFRDYSILAAQWLEEKQQK